MEAEKKKVIFFRKSMVPLISGKKWGKSTTFSVNILRNERKFDHENIGTQIQACYTAEQSYLYIGSIKVWLWIKL